jgi:hypothetical protein
MALLRRSSSANAVRVPVVPRGEAVSVSRYRESSVKAVVINPEDLKMFEESFDLIQEIAALEPLELDGDMAHHAVAEARPGEVVEDPEQIRAFFFAA